MKKIYFYSALLSFLSTYAFADPCPDGQIIGAKTGNCIDSSGSCGTNCNYSIDTNGHVSITSTGNGIIDDNMFANNLDVVSVDIGNGIQKIGNYAFQSTTNATNINIPNSVTQYGYDVFKGSSVKSLTIPPIASLDMCFITRSYSPSSYNIQELYLPEGLTSLNGTMHLAKTGITKLVVPESVTSSNAIIGQGFSSYFTAYCTGQQISNNICSAQSTRYEHEDDRFVVYNSDGSVYGIYSDFKDIVTDKAIDSYTKTTNGITYTYDGHGNLLSAYRENSDGSKTLYDRAGHIVGFKGKRIYTVEEAEILSKKTGNKFKVRYK